MDTKELEKRFKQILLDAHNPEYMKEYLELATTQYNQKNDDNELLYSPKMTQIDVFYESGTIKAIFDQVNWDTVDIEAYICNGFIEYFSLIKDHQYLTKALELFNIKGFKYTPITYSTLLDYYCHQQNKEVIEELISALKRDYDYKLPDYLMVTLMKACLMVDNFKDANLLYSRILDSAYRYNTQALDHLLEYHLGKSHPSTILKFFQRNLPYSKGYVKTSKFFGSFMVQAIQKGVKHEDIISFLISRNLVDARQDFFTLYFHLLRSEDPKMRELGSELYYKFSHKKSNVRGQEYFSNCLKTLMLIGNSADVIDLFDTYKGKEKLLFFHYQSMLEFFHKRKEEQHFDLVLDQLLKTRSYKSLFIPMFYFELTGNTELVEKISKAIVVKGKELEHAELIPTISNMMIYGYLSLDMYEQALEWYGKKSLGDYASAIPNSVFENFASYHKERNQKSLEQVWLSQVIGKKINVIKSTILRDDQDEKPSSKNNKEENNREKTFLDTFLTDLEYKWAIVNVYNPGSKSLKSVVDKYNASKHQNPLFEEICKSKRFIPDVVNTLKTVYLNKDIIPPGSSLIKSFNLLAKHSPSSYFDMLKKASPRIRSIVFNPSHLASLFDEHLSEALELYVENEYLRSSHISFNTIAQYLLKKGQIELAICVIRKMIADKLRINVDTLLLDILVDIGKINHPIVQELTNYFSFYSYIIPTIVTAELDRLIEQGSIDEAYEFFLKAPKYPETLKTALKIFSIKFPIPPITNLMHWSSLVQLSSNTNRLFYEYFYETLYNNNLTNIVNLYIDKVDEDSIYHMSQKEFLIVLKSCKNSVKAIKLFKRFPHTELLPEIIEEVKKYNLFVKDVEVSYRLEYKTKIYTEPEPEPLYKYKTIEDKDVRTILKYFTNINPDDVIIENSPTSCRIIFI